MLVFVCSHCQETRKYYSLDIDVDFEDRSITAFKYGERPMFEEPTPTRLLTLFEDDKDLYFKGRQCEVFGLGVGAAAYYRRVVENQKDRLFDAIISACRKLKSPQEMIEELEAAKKEVQFTKALETLKDAVPESLYIDGINPLILLHRALSHQVHELPDVECLSEARDLRLVLFALAERLHRVLKDETEVLGAVRRLMDNHSKRDAPMR